MTKTPPPSKPKAAKAKRSLATTQVASAKKPVAKQKTPPPATKRSDRRLSKLEQPLADLPPLSKPIPYLEGKLTAEHRQGKFYFTTIHPDTDWNSAASLRNFYKPFSNLGQHTPPVCLLQDAATDQDRLTILNWWRFLSQPQQKQAMQDLRNIYATPCISNRLLPADYWIRIAEADKKREQAAAAAAAPKPPQAVAAAVAPKPPPSPPRPKPCPGWKGPKYNGIFQLALKSYSETADMSSSRAVLSTDIPILFSKNKSAPDLCFMADNDGFVLKAKDCLQIVQPKEEDGNNHYAPHKRCTKCSKYTDAISSLLATAKKLSAKEQDAAKNLQKAKDELRQAARREKRLRERVQRQKEKLKDGNDTTAKKKKEQSNAAKALASIGKQTKKRAAHDSEEEDDDDDDDDEEGYGDLPHRQWAQYQQSYASRSDGTYYH